MHPDVQELQVKLKEILYDCATEVKATKAALYVRDTSSNRFELVTEYGFRGAARPAADEKNPIVDKFEKTRSAFFVNGLTAEPRFSEMLFESQSDRLLAAPIYIRGQLVGLVDMRDKGGKAPFEMPDLQKAQLVADRIALVLQKGYDLEKALAAERRTFPPLFISLASVGEQTGTLISIVHNLNCPR